MQVKKNAILAFILVGATLSAQQTFVSISPSNKNVVLEEFTGINSDYCPDGHRIVDDIVAANPNRVFAINIHAGGYAANTYTTFDGDRLRDKWNVTSYPSGMINRTTFTGTSPIYGEFYFSQYTNNQLNTPACANIAARCTIDCATRVMTVNVQLFYTDNSSVDTNFISAALVQDNIPGPQRGASYYPSQVINGQYNHMHMFRGFVNGSVWGDTVTTTDSGSFVARTYTYTLPQTIGNAPVRINDLSIVAFVSEGKANIINSCKAAITYTNADLMLSDMQPADNQENCNIEFPAYVRYVNLGQTIVNSIEIKYGTNISGTATYTRSGLNITRGFSDTIHLPTITGSFLSGVSYTGYATITSINGVAVSNDTIKCLLRKNKYNTYGDSLTLTINTDAYGRETTYKFMKIDGTSISSGGPFQNLASAGTMENVIKIGVPANGCYMLEVYDAAGDGINSDYGNGSFSLADNRGTVFTDNGQFGAKAQYLLNCTLPNSITPAQNVDFAVYPNPAGGTLNIDCGQKVLKTEIFDMQGRILLSQDNAEAISLLDLPQGSYIVRVTTPEGTAIRTFVKE